MNVMLIGVVIASSFVVNERDVDINVDPVRETAPSKDKRKPKLSLKNIEDSLDRLHWEKFVDQAIRVNQLQVMSSRVDGWVYSTGHEQIVGEYEQALICIERADRLLRTEMDLAEMDWSRVEHPVDYVEQAAQELDKAQLSIDMLIGMALYDY